MNEYQSYLEDKSYIFTLIKNRNFSVVEEIISKENIDVNIVDRTGNDILMRLLKNKKYDLVMTLMKKRSWNVNKQNYDGDTFGHILVEDNSIGAIKIMDELTKNKKYLPNIKNKKGQTVLDKAIKNNYLAYAFKIIKDERFDSIDISSFKKLFLICINRNYGKYSIISNLEIIITSLEDKNLSEGINNIIDDLKRNFYLIKEEILNNKNNILKTIVGI